MQHTYWHCSCFFPICFPVMPLRRWSGPSAYRPDPPLPRSIPPALSPSPSSATTITAGKWRGAFPDRRVEIPLSTATVSWISVPRRPPLLWWWKRYPNRTADTVRRRSSPCRSPAARYRSRLPLIMPAQLPKAGPWIMAEASRWKPLPKTATALTAGWRTKRS